MSRNTRISALAWARVEAVRRVKMIYGNMGLAANKIGVELSIDFDSVPKHCVIRALDMITNKIAERTFPMHLPQCSVIDEFSAVLHGVSESRKGVVLLIGRNWNQAG